MGTKQGNNEESPLEVGATMDKVFWNNVDNVGNKENERPSHEQVVTGINYKAWQHDNN